MPLQCHTDGGSLVWDAKAPDEMSDAVADIAGDRAIKVLIHTGAGLNYDANWRAGRRQGAPRPALGRGTVVGLIGAASQVRPIRIFAIIVALGNVPVIPESM
jgi:hypothetical protein